MLTAKSEIPKWKVVLSSVLMLGMTFHSCFMRDPGQGGPIEQTISIQKAEAVAPAVWLLVSIFAADATAVATTGKSIIIGPILKTSFNNVIGPALNGFLSSVAYVEYVTIKLLNMGYTYFYDKMFDVPPEVKTIWQKMRDFVNISAVVVFMVLVLANLFGIRPNTYSIKKALPRALLALVAVNLSYVIAIFVMDNARLVTDIIGGLFDFKDVTDFQFVEFSRFLQVNPDSVRDQFTLTVQIILCGIFMFMMILPLFAITAALVMATVMIWLLLAVSPLAYLGLMVPGQDQIWRYWWKSFITLLLIPIKITFILGMVFMVQKAFVFGSLEGMVTEVSSTTELNQNGLAAVFEEVLKYLPFFQEANYEQVNASVRFEGLLMFILVTMGLWVAVRKALDDSLTGRILDFAERGGKFLSRQVGRVTGAVGAAPVYSIRSAWKAGKAGLERRKERKHFGRLAVNTRSKAMDLMTNAAGHRRMAGVAATDAERQSHMQQAFEMEAKADHLNSDVRHYGNLSQSTFRKRGNLKAFRSEQERVEERIKEVKEHMARGDSVDKNRELDLNTQLRLLEARKAELAQHDEAGKETRKGRLGGATRFASDFAGETVGAYLKSGSALEAGKKILMQAKGNREWAKDQEATEIAHNVAKAITWLNTKSPTLGGIVGKTGADDSIEGALSREVDGDYRKAVAGKYADVLEHGTTGELMNGLESIKKSDRLSQVARETFISALIQKAEFMSFDEANRFQKIINSAHDKAIKGLDKKVRPEFEKSFKDMAGIMRSKSPFFINARITDTGFHGFAEGDAAYNLSKITMNLAKNPSFPELMNFLKNELEQGRKVYKGNFSSTIYNNFNDRQQAAYFEIPDDSLTNMKSFVEAFIAGQDVTVQQAFQDLKDEIEQKEADRAAADAADTRTINRLDREITTLQKQLAKFLEKLSI